MQVEALGKLRCPVAECGTYCSEREIRRHINNKHPRIRLDAQQLASVRSVQCACGEVVSATGKGAHQCFAEGHSQATTSRRLRSNASDHRTEAGQAQPVSEALRAEESPSSSTEALAPAFETSERPEPGTTTPQAPRTQLRADLGESGQVTPPLGQFTPPVGLIVTPEDDRCQIRYASSTVPRKARQAFSEVATEAIRKVLGCASRDLNEQQAAQHEFTVLPSRVLHASLGSRRRSSNVLSSIRQYRGGIQVAAELSAARRSNLERGSHNECT
jgi:hypothetical protein